jgi:hypothetical protein
MSEIFIRCAFAASLLMAAVAVFGQSQETATCGSNIVSPTVVSTYCGHRMDSVEMLDLMILWRGTPGWFQRAGGGGGGGGSSQGGGTKGRVYQYSTYGDITIGFDADFDANTVKIGEELLALGGVNAVFVDGVDEPGARRISATRWIEPGLALTSDMNKMLVLARRSRELLDYLRCDIPMPEPPPTRFPRPRMPIVTVCEKLKPK